MAEENHTQQFTGSDDMSAMRAVLMSVKGISPISLAPELEAVPVDDFVPGEQFQFE